MSLNTSDAEKLKSGKEFQVGFADFAEYIASDRELSLYRGFHPLAARNLLYLQAELQVLGNELIAMDEEDKRFMSTIDDENERIAIDRAARTWEGISTQYAAGNRREMKRMDLILKLRKLVKEYEKALLRRSQILSLESPDRGTTNAFTNWFRFKNPLRGLGWHLLDNEHDLIALKTSKDPDGLTSFIQYCFGYYLRETRDNQPPSWGRMYYFKTSIINKIVTAISVVISAFFFIGAIIILYFVNAMGARLGIVSAFTALFAATVGLMTNAKRAEIFAATAAYAAVLVVYVSGNIGTT